MPRDSVNISRLLTLFGLGIVGIAAAGLVFDTLYPPQLDFSAAPAAAAGDSVSVPTTITIPAAGIHVPVTSGTITNNEWTVADNAANHLATSATPGGGGNIVIYGHDSRHLFGNLAAAAAGQEVSITAHDGTIHTYKITTVYETKPDNLDPVQPTDHEILTVYTCTGFANSKRLIIQARK